MNGQKNRCREHGTLMRGRCSLPLSLGTLSNDDGSENVAKKMNLCSLKLIHVYLDPLNMSNAGNFYWRWILKDLFRLKKIKGNRRSMITCSIKRQIRSFHVVVVQWTAKKCTKKRDASVELLFWSLNLIVFLKSSLWSSSWLLKLPNNSLPRSIH